MKTLLAILITSTLLTGPDDGMYHTTNYNALEAISDLEDMKEWISWDIEEGKIDSLVGNLLIENLDVTIQTLDRIN